jgi:P4 family phage/plasmid primase-like protien
MLPGNLVGHYTPGMKSSLVDLLRTSKPWLHAEPPPDRISLRNGLLLLNDQIGEVTVAVDPPSMATGSKGMGSDGASSIPSHSGSKGGFEFTYPVYRLIPTPRTHLSTIQLPMTYAPGLLPAGTRLVRTSGMEMIDLGFGVDRSFHPAPLPTIPLNSEALQWLPFLTSIFPEDSFQLALEILGAPLSSSRSIQESIWLYGPGGNGKSTFLEAMQLMIGRRNCCSIPISNLTNNRFMMMHLRHKLLWVDPDAPAEAIQHSHIFKTIISGDVLSADRKYKDAIEFSPYCKVVLASNECPKTPDRSIGFMRRIVMLPFVGFDSTLNNTHAIRMESILRQLGQPAELSSMLNFALSGLKTLLKTGRYTKPASVLEATQEWQDAHRPPVDVFLSEMVDETPELNLPTACTFLTMTDLYTAYREYVKRKYPSAAKVLSSISSISFGLWIARFRPTWKKIRPRAGIGGARPRGFRGVQWSAGFAMEFPDIAEKLIEASRENAGIEGLLSRG